MSMRAGIALDHTTATVVIAHTSDKTPTTGPTGDVGDALNIEAVHVVDGATPAAALSNAARLIAPGTPIRVTLADPATAGATLDATAADLTRRGFTRTARSALGRPEAAVCGAIGDLTVLRDGGVQAGFAATAPTDLIAEAYRALRGWPVEVTTAAMARHYRGTADGLHLALRRGSSEVTLVVDQMPRATVVLDGGLRQALAALAGQSLDGDLTQALASDHTNPLLRGALTRWLNNVAAGVNQAREEWQRRGLTAPTLVQVTGIGAGAAPLREVLGQHGLTVARLRLRNLPHPDPTQVWEGYLAAASLGSALPTAALPDPDEVAPAAARPTLTARLASLGAGNRPGRRTPVDDRAAAAVLAATATAANAKVAVSWAEALETATAGTPATTSGQVAAAALRRGKPLPDALAGAGLIDPSDAPALDTATATSPATAVRAAASSLAARAAHHRLTSAVHARRRQAGALATALTVLVLAVLDAGHGTWATRAAFGVLALLPALTATRMRSAVSSQVADLAQLQRALTWARRAAAGDIAGPAQASRAADRAVEAIWGSGPPVLEVTAELAAAVRAGRSTLDTEAQLTSWLEVAAPDAATLTAAIAATAARQALLLAGVVSACTAAACVLQALTTP